MNLRIAINLGKEGKFDEAIYILLGLPPTASQAYLLGLCYMNLGDVTSAQRAFQTCLEFDSTHPGANLNLGNFLITDGLYEEAIKRFRKGQKRAKGTDRLGILLGMAYSSIKIGADKDGGHYFTLAQQLKPNLPEVNNLAGLIEEKSGNLEAAKRYFTDALSCTPNLLAARVNLARIYARLGQPNTSIRILDQVVNGQIDLETILSSAALYRSIGHRDRALSLLDQANTLWPNSMAVFLSCFGNHVGNREWDMAHYYYRQLQSNAPLNIKGNEDLLMQYAMGTCDWDLMSIIDNAIGHRGTVFLKSLSPLTLSYICDEPQTVFESAKREAKHFSKIVSAEKIFTDQRNIGNDGETLRIGYMSGDFRSHAVGQLTESLFSAHVKRGTYVVGFYTGPSVEQSDRYHSSIRSSFTAWYDLSGLDRTEILKLIDSENLDILIDLSGHTNYSRLDVLASHPARLTATYLGFPGTTGLENVDFIFADDFVITESNSSFLSEHEIIRLEPCYQVNSNLRALPKDDRRADWHLPEDLFIFCSFNSPQKITAPQFANWIDILRKCPESILWLFAPEDVTRENITRAVDRAELSRSRIVFAGYCSPDEHISRMSLADLFLDCFPYTAHTTASDAIWAGLPVITKTGKSFHSRVCASILRAVNLEEFICDTDSDFVSRACFYYRNKDVVARVKDRLIRERSSLSLFDSSGIAEQIENAVFSALREQ